MRKRVIWITISIVFILLGAFQYKHITQTEATFSNAMLKRGSEGNDVRELQGRLNFLGYYDGKIDGVFGSGTQNAVKSFQSKFGMKSDGIVGAKTKQTLVDATKNWNSSTDTTPSPSNNTISSSNHLGYTENDLKFMANAVYGEARGEPYEGKVAVAAVILNRVKSPLFGKTPYDVIFQPGAFTAVDDGQIWLTPDKEAKRAVQDAINGSDPSGGCIYYFNPDTATSEWIWTRPQVKTIGHHIFCM